MLLIWTLCRLAQGLVLLYVWRTHKAFVPARDWALGSLVAVPGLAFVCLRGLVPDCISSLAANCFLIPGWMLFDFGVMRAAGRRPPWLPGLAACAAALGLQTWFSLISPDDAARALVFSGTILLFDGLAAGSCLTCRDRTGFGMTLKLVGGVFLVHILSGMWRAAAIVSATDPSLLAPVPAQIQHGYVAILATFVVTALLVLLTSQKLQEDLRELAHRDPLTMACNRRILDEVAANHWNCAANASVACLMLDIDHFKLFNDTYGHQAGDAALVAVSRAARGLLRAEDTWCRFGGEEFLALLPHTDARQARGVAERLRATIAGLALEAPGGPAHITVSIGVAEANADSLSWPELVGRSDRALYQAKRNGRDRVEVDDDTLPIPQGRGFVHLTWNEAYACGQELIDTQHRQLFTAANDLLAALLTGASKAVCQKHIEALLADVLRHFHDEEATLRAAGYAGVDAHAAIHRQLLDKAQELANRYDDDILPMGELFDFLAMDVVSRHMLSEDRKFFPCLRDRASRNAPAGS